MRTLSIPAVTKQCVFIRTRIVTYILMRVRRRSATEPLRRANRFHVVAQYTCRP